MIFRRTLLVGATCAVMTVAAPGGLVAAEPTRVVASFSVLGDMVQRIGGEHVALTTLVGADGDAHVYQPTPADARAVSGTELMIVNGLEFEGWLDRLIDAAEYKGVRIVATRGIEPIAFEDDDDHGHDDDKDHGHDDHAEGKDHAHDDDHDHAEGKDHAHDDDHDHAKKDEHGHDEHGHDHHDHGAFDPHAWQSLTAAMSYVDTITAALATADPANASTFYENRAAYVAEIEALDAEIRAMIAALPEDRRTVVTSHDAFQYFARDYGLTFLAPQGLSTESEASAKDVAELIKQMRAEGISAVFMENITDSRLIEQIARETGATVGGTLYPDALSGPDGPAATYLDMMRHNATTIAQALSS